ncbi:MAG: hypothetical protein ACR2MQ_13595 [Gemmatimonadaceae bacterium]
MPSARAALAAIGASIGASIGAGILVSTLVAVACRPSPVAPPAAEFIVATPDSTYWVSSGTQGIHVRAVPMTITQYGGRFHEIYVADVDRSFSDAVFTGERVYTRDLVTGDSTLVYDDTAVVGLAAHHARVHPEALPLADDDDTPTDPTVAATGETDIVEVRGPYALLEHRFSFEHMGGEQHDTVRTAVDLRTGRAASSADLAHDVPAIRDSMTLRLVPRTWKRSGYNLLARGDAASGSVSLSLHDRSDRSWPLISVSTAARVYWLDTPPIDTAARRALAHAFNEAAAYDESTSFVDFVRPSPAPIARFAAHSVTTPHPPEAHFQ